MSSNQFPVADLEGRAMISFENEHAWLTLSSATQIDPWRREDRILTCSADVINWEELERSS